MRCRYCNQPIEQVLTQADESWWVHSGNGMKSCQTEADPETECPRCNGKKVIFRHNLKPPAYKEQYGEVECPECRGRGSLKPGHVIQSFSVRFRSTVKKDA